MLSKPQHTKIFIKHSERNAFFIAKKNAKIIQKKSVNISKIKRKKTMDSLSVLILEILQRDDKSVLSSSEICKALFDLYAINVNQKTVDSALSFLSTYRADVIKVTTDRVGDKRIPTKKYSYNENKL